mmetsp:Transcript_70710/g.207066  ORF Transcript_70710/g.207066 Transcript_70710/m.207066 type:complete len:245 (-) Transcript_70710:566-1300(-)
MRLALKGAQSTHGHQRCQRESTQRALVLPKKERVCIEHVARLWRHQRVQHQLGQPRREQDPHRAGHPHTVAAHPLLAWRRRLPGCKGPTRARLLHRWLVDRVGEPATHGRRRQRCVWLHRNTRRELLGAVPDPLRRQRGECPAPWGGQGRKGDPSVRPRRRRDGRQQLDHRRPLRLGRGPYATGRGGRSCRRRSAGGGVRDAGGGHPRQGSARRQVPGAPPHCRQVADRCLGQGGEGRQRRSAH